MASTRFRILISVTAVIAAMAAPAGATPVLDYWDFLTLRNSPNPLSSVPEGDFVFVGAAIIGASTPDSISSLRVEATQGALTVPLDFDAHITAVTAPDAVYFALMPFATAQTGIGWNITASDSTGTSAPVFAYPIANPVLLPFATDITVSDTSTTPTVSWALPDLTGFSVGLIRFRIIDAGTEDWLLNTVLAADAKSFPVPGGILALGESYVYSVTLDNGGSPSEIIENESSAYSGVTRVPEPGTLMLMLAALATIGGARLHETRNTTQG